MKPLLSISKLSVSIDGKKIIRNFSLSVKPGELHVLMGPNGSGKSTVANALMGSPNYTVKATKALYGGKKLLSLGPDERAREGLFLGFQYPLTIAGVPLAVLIAESLRARIPQPTASSTKGYLTLAHKESARMAADRFTYGSTVVKLARDLKLRDELLERGTNDGFSGGEKKKAEILQMAALAPRLAILDEPDSGLDIDALKLIAKAIDRAHKAKTAVILITHYSRIVQYLHPTKVHIMKNGRIVKSGTKALARQIERKGYDAIRTK